MMNLENENLDLGLALGYSDQCVQMRSSNNSGAGVNAASRVDMTFVPSDPLSELVRSPNHCLSLKCTDIKLVDKKPSLLWVVGPSNMVLSPSQSIKSRGNNDDKQIDEGHSTTSQTAFRMDSKIAGIVSLARSPRGSTGPVLGSYHGHLTGSDGIKEEVDTIEGVSVLHCNEKEEYVEYNKETGECSLKNIEIDTIAKASEINAGVENQRENDFQPLVTDASRTAMAVTEASSDKFNKQMAGLTDRMKDVPNDSRTLGLEIALASEIQTVNRHEIFDSPVADLPFQRRRHKELALVIEEGSKYIEKHGSNNEAPMEKLEFTAENDLQPLISTGSCGKSDERSPMAKSVPPEASPTNSRILLYQRKGKEKALSDGDVNEQLSKDKDDSHESVESCNSTGLFSKGKKRWSFDQQLIVGSKRIKKQIQESPASTSLSRQNSSFMNWLSNMVKGLAKSNQDGTPLPHTLAHSNSWPESHDHKIMTCNENHDSSRRDTGFQSIFQSLYCPNTKVQETRISDGDYPVGGSEEPVVADKICADVTPISCCGENDKSCKFFVVPNEKLKPCTFGDDEGPSTHPCASFANIAAIQETCKTNSAENKAPSNLACGKTKDGVSSSHSTLEKCKKNSVVNSNYDAPSEGKAFHHIGCGRDLLGSLWVTRFSPQTPSHILNLDQCNQGKHVAFQRSTDCSRLVNQNGCNFQSDHKSSGPREYSNEDPANVVGRELQNYGPSAEASFGFKRIYGQNYQKSICKLNPILPFQKFKSSEAMASVFARRLDAFNHILPLDVNDDVARMTITCFFCGKSGHDLRDCSEITEAELRDLLRNISSYDGAEESPCLCIRCFQLDHWAIRCPMASSSKQQQSENSASLFNHYGSSKFQLCTVSKRNSSMLERKEGPADDPGGHIISSKKNPRKDTDLCLNPIWNVTKIHGGKISSSDEVQKHIASWSGENELKGNQIMPLCHFISNKISDVPKGMFDSIRRLRLSRVDILKLMNSHISLLRLDGFFLRLRLGKWEERLRGTGYYVACITGIKREKSPKNSKHPISVNIGGVKCVVERQYISNHDFLEDELTAWWCTTLKSGGKIPSENDFKSKIEGRKKLGV